MTSGSFIIELKDSRNISIPPEVTNHLQLQEGDKVEVVIKKIRSKRLDIKISKNPLVKLLNLPGEPSES